MILAGIAANTGFARRDIERLDAAGARWWWNACMAFQKHVAEESS